MNADSYQTIFHNRAPVGRMLRRQINNGEYIALSNEEFKQLAVNNEPQHLDAIVFVIPEIKMVRGYYATEMKIINYGAVKKLTYNASPQSYTVQFDKKPMLTLRTTNQFIRWLGL